MWTPATEEPEMGPPGQLGGAPVGTSRRSDEAHRAQLSTNRFVMPRSSSSGPGVVRRFEVGYMSRMPRPTLDVPTPSEARSTSDAASTTADVFGALSDAFERADRARGGRAGCFARPWVGRCLVVARPWVGRCLAVAVAALPAVAHAQKLPTDDPKSKPQIAAAEPPPPERLASEHTVVARLNPLGLIYFSRLSYRLRLFESDSPVAKNNFVGFGLAPSASPAFARIGALVEIQPLSILQLWATYELVGYFGTFEFFQSFPGVTAEHDDTTLEDLSVQADDAPTKNYGTSGTQLNLGSVLQAKVGPIAARNLTRFSRSDFDLREGDRTFYDPVFDLLVPDEGWFMVNDLDVLWVTDLGLTVGARWTMTHAFYEDRHYAPGEDRSGNPNTPHHRLGPLVAYTFWDDQGRSKLDRPTVLLIVNWWLEHRYRTGADVDQAFPYTILGFSITGDLLAP